MLKGSNGGRGEVALCELGGWRSRVWRMEEGVCAARGPGEGTGGAEKRAGGVLPRNGSVRGSLCIAPLGTVALCSRMHGAVCAERVGDVHCPMGQEQPVPGGPREGLVTLFSHSGVQLHLSMALLAQAPLPLPSGTAPPDFPRCLFLLC